MEPPVHESTARKRGVRAVSLKIRCNSKYPRDQLATAAYYLGPHRHFCPSIEPPEDT